MTDETLAKHLLNGSSCSSCRFHDNSFCKLVRPIEVKYPEDVQVFINGTLSYDGTESGFNAIIVVGNKIHINQYIPNSMRNSASLQLFGSELIQVYSRGINENGKYECQKISFQYQLFPIPQENLCIDYIPM